MSKITNDGLTRSGTGCFIAYDNSGRQRINKRLVSVWMFIQYLRVFFDWDDEFLRETDDWSDCFR